MLVVIALLLVVIILLMLGFDLEDIWALLLLGGLALGALVLAVPLLIVLSPFIAWSIVAGGWRMLLKRSKRSIRKSPAQA